MFYLIYKTTNLLTNQYYIGVHQTLDKNDNYLGSGIWLKRAIRKYGRINFKREIIEECLSFEESYEKETVYIEKARLRGDKLYNIQPGGKGGWHHVNSTDMHKGLKNCMHRDDIKKKVGRSQSKTKNGENKEFYDNIARTNGAKAAEKMRGRVVPEETRNKLSKSLSRQYIILAPDGKIYEYHGSLRAFCDNHDISVGKMYHSAKFNNVIENGRGAGWKVIKSN